jgi:hypothetical protein
MGRLGDGQAQAAREPGGVPQGRLGRCGSQALGPGGERRGAKEEERRREKGKKERKKKKKEKRKEKRKIEGK